MLGKLSGWADTICALSTPPGIGAIGVIRVSGPQALSTVQQLFSGKNLIEQASHTLHLGLLKHQGQVLDEVVLGLYKAPRSFTGEDVVEIGTHGSPFIQQQVLQALAAAGCRLARPGEFTQRAFLNGKMNLSEAEAVADLIASNTEASKNLALNQMRGGYSHALAALRNELLSFSALLELELDFSQEDVEFADKTQFRRFLENARRMVTDLLASFRLGNVLKNGVATAIVGAPNAGKSTLLNALLKEERAIVSSIAGTTRDTIEASLNIDGVLFRLIDTAGIRAQTEDSIEQIGIGRSLDAMAKADLIVYLFDLSTETVETVAAKQAELAGYQHKILWVGNKADLPEAAAHAGSSQLALSISASRPDDVRLLEKLMHQQALAAETTANQTIVSNARHASLLAQIQTQLQHLQEALEQGLPGDLMAPDIRLALHHLGELTGEVTNEDQLDYIFSKFCIGK